MRKTSLSKTVPGGIRRLARTFPAQIEAPHPLSEPWRTCHHRAERVGRDGGKAIVGNVTQHASVIVSDKNRATAVTARGGPMPTVPNGSRLLAFTPE